MRKICLSAILILLTFAMWGCGASGKKGLAGTTWISDKEKLTFEKDGSLSAIGGYFYSGEWEELDEGMVSIIQEMTGKENYFYDISDEGILTLTNAYRDSNTSEWTRGSMSYHLVKEGLSTDLLYNIDSDTVNNIEETESDNETTDEKIAESEIMETEEAEATEDVSNEETIDQTEENTTADEEETEFLVNIADDPVVYDDQGVKICIIGVDNDYKLFFSIENNNPDNKKVLLGDSNLASINGLCASNDIYTIDKDKTALEPILTGETRNYYFKIDKYEYTKALDLLEVPNMPIEKLSLDLWLAVGSDEEYQDICKTVKTEKYSESDMNSYLGEYITTVDADIQYYPHDLPLDIYYKENSNGGFVVNVVNTGDMHIGSYLGCDIVPEIRVNGEKINGDSDGWSFYGVGIANGDCLLIPCILTDDDIRKQLEISNDDNYQIVLTDPHNTTKLVDIPIVTR